jgi:hypothetical protein
MELLAAEHSENLILVLKRVPGMIKMIKYACRNLFMNDFGARAGPPIQEITLNMTLNLVALSKP